MTNEQNERNARINELSEQRAIVEQKVAELDEQIKKLVELAESAESAESADPNSELDDPVAFHYKLRAHVDELFKNEDGSLWLRKSTLRNPPRFVPIEDRPTDAHGRSTRILSFINFKGGVGKTTIVMNLCGVFGGGFYKTPDGAYGNPLRVLIVDLDFQGTLSQRVADRSHLANSTLKDADSSALLAVPNRNASLNALTQPVIELPYARIITSSEVLDRKDSEFYLKLQLKLYESRFYFRNWFHADDCFKNYDLVLFDCPPRVTASTVNALAVSDFVFIPTIPEPFDIRPVIRTQTWLAQIRSTLKLDFRFGGVILNRTKSQNELASSEKDAASEFKQAKLKLEPGDNPSVLKTHIPKRNGQTDSFQGEAGKAIPSATLNPKLSSMNDLASEIYARIYQ